MNYIGKVINIGSSSEGNAFYIEIKRKEYEKPFGLLIECGFEVPNIMKKLLNHGVSILDVNAVLITHEHNDHSVGLKDLVGYGVKAFAPRQVFEKYEIGESYLRKDLKEFVETSIADKIRVLPIPLDHENPDGTKCVNFGYIITIESEFRILFITDTKYIRYNLSNFEFDMIFIEANNRVVVLKLALKDAIENDNIGKKVRYNRVLESHMTVENTARTLATFNLSKTKIVYLIHLTSDRKKNEQTFIEIIENKLRKENKQIPPIVVADMRGNFIK